MSTQVNGRGLRSAKNIQRSGSEWESFFREWNGTGFSLNFFRGIGTGKYFFLWEWDGRCLKIHSRVNL